MSECVCAFGSYGAAADFIVKHGLESKMTIRSVTVSGGPKRFVVVPR